MRRLAYTSDLRLVGKDPGKTQASWGSSVHQVLPFIPALPYAALGSRCQGQAVLLGAVSIEGKRAMASEGL